MGKITRNRAQNLLCIPFALCLLGCVHAMDEVRTLGGTTSWSSISDRPKPEYLNLNEGWVVPSLDGGVKFVREGTTQSEIICFGSLEEMRRFFQDCINNYSEQNNGADLVNDFKDTVGPGVSWAELEREHGPLLAASLALRPGVFEKTLEHFTSDDLKTLFMDSVTAVGWDGFGQMIKPIRILGTLADRNQYDVLWDIVSKIPTMVFRKMGMMEILTRLVANNYADNVVELMMKMSKEELQEMHDYKLLEALVSNNHAADVAALIQEKGINLTGSRYKYHVCSGELFQMCVRLVENGQAKFVADLIRKDSNQLMNILGICELLRVLAANGEDEFVMSLMNDNTLHKLLHPAYEFSIFKMTYSMMKSEKDDPSFFLEVLVQKGHADAVGAVIVREPQLLQALKKIDRVLDALAAAGRNDLGDEIRRRIEVPELT